MKCICKTKVSPAGIHDNWLPSNKNGLRSYFSFIAAHYLLNLSTFRITRSPFSGFLLARFTTSEIISRLPYRLLCSIFSCLGHFYVRCVHLVLITSRSCSSSSAGICCAHHPHWPCLPILRIFRGFAPVYLGYVCHLKGASLSVMI